LITALQITNFRKFPAFSLRLRKGNILVGPNNAGKSSVLDAFRLLEACYRHAKTRNPRLIQISDGNVFQGYEIPDSVMPFSLANATHNYSDGDAILDFEHDTKAHAIIRVHPERQTLFYIDFPGGRLTTSSKFRKAFPIDLVIIPTLAPLEADELLVQPATVQRNATTRLASRHLRNFWLDKPEEEFNSFRDDVERAWPTIRLKKPELRRSNPPVVEMYYSEDRIDREVQWAGFGFQVWMQIQTHLRRGQPEAFLVIDEPDIYLHPDLQHRLLRTVRGRFSQFMMATHSVEIVNDAEPDEIVSINPRYRSGKRVQSEEEYASLYRYLGSGDNADFARIAKARKVIFVEGRDGRLIRRLASRLRFDRLANSQGTPIIQLGGFSQWKRAIHTVWAFETLLDLEIDAFCIFDRDYRCDEEVSSFLIEAHAPRVQSTVLGRKEIENYLLVPEALQRAIDRRLRAKGGPSAKDPICERVMNWLRVVTNEFKFKVMSRRVGSILERAHATGSPVDRNTIIEKYSSQFENKWEQLSFRLSYAPGKEVLGRLNEVLQDELRISVTEVAIVEQLSTSSTDPELLGILDRLNVFCDD
jgi:AAA domain, putative AbiEii toxin, Type IV TA system